MSADVPQGSIEGRAARVSLVNGLSSILTLLAQIVSVPVCLHYWGKENYGAWLAVFSAHLLLRSVDGGYTLYVGNKLNYLYHVSIPRMRLHLSSARAGVAVLAVVELLLVAAAFFFGPLERALGMPADSALESQAKLSLLVLMASWVLTGAYIGIVDRLFIPANLMHQAAWLAMGLQALQFAVIITAATLRLDLLDTSVLCALAQAAIYICSLLYARGKLPEFFPLRPHFQWRLGLADLRHSSLLTVSNLVQQGTASGAVLMVAALAGPAGVPAFTTIRTLANLWTQITTVLSSPLLPDLVRFHVRSEARKILAVNRAYWTFVGSAVNWGTLLAYPLLPVIYGDWTTRALPLDGALLSLMLGAVVVANAGALMALHLSGVNSLGIMLTGSLVRATLTLGAGFAGFHRIGLASFGLGILVAEVLVALLSGRHFIRRELIARGVHPGLAEFGPVTLGTGSAALFFLGMGLGWWSGIVPWSLALAGVATASAWGWITLEPDIRNRILALPMRLLRR